jgi:hypothetical protein
MIKNPPIPHSYDKPSRLDPEAMGDVQQEPRKEGESISDTWEKVLELIERNELNEAY